MLKRKQNWLPIILIVIFVGLGLIGIHNSSKFHLETQTYLMMDTFVTISVPGPKKISLPAINLTFQRLKEIEVKFNSLNPESPIYAFNHKNIPISDPEILELIKVSLQVSKESEGAFDITVAPLVELWGFYGKSHQIPKGEEINEALKTVGYQYLLLNNGKLTKDDKEVRIDLGGIAKGYALREAVKVLKTQGISFALIDAGGDIYALGRKNNKLWRVGIRNPRQKGLLGYVEAEDTAVISSGDYERSFIKDGKRYHHIFNPKTGYPTAEGVAAVTLIHPDPILAQAWAKIPFILGAQLGLKLLEGIPGMQAMLITDSGEILYSGGVKKDYFILDR